MASIPPDPQRSNELSQLERLAERLTELNDAFERGGTVAIDKKRARQERGEVILEISVVLARLGEIGLVETLERFPFQRKVEALGGFVPKRRVEQMSVTDQHEPNLSGKHTMAELTRDQVLVKISRKESLARADLSGLDLSVAICPGPISGAPSSTGPTSRMRGFRAPT